MRIKRLDEKSATSKVKSALFGDKRGLIRTFAVLMAGNPMEKRLSDIENRPRNNTLRKNIEVIKKSNKDYDENNIERSMRILGLQYIRIKGKFGNDENSFLVLNLSYNDAETLARRNRQLSFFYGTCTNIKDDDGEYIPINAVIKYYVTDADEDTPTEEIEYHLAETSSRIDDMSEADDFFSSHGSLKWSFYMKCLNESPLSVYKISNEKLFESSLDDTFTMRGRSIYRRNSRKQID